MPLTRIEHLLVLTDEIEATRDFYVEALGLREGERPPLEFPGSWLYLGEVPTVHVADRRAFSEHSERVGIPASAAAKSTGAVDHIAFNGTATRPCGRVCASSGSSRRRTKSRTSACASSSSRTRTA